MILVDYSSISMSSVMVRIHEFEDNIDLIRHQIYNMIRQYNLEYRDKYGEMVLCMDSKNNWRKDIFPHYKANRKKSRDESSHNWKAIFAVMDEVREELINYGTFRCVRVDKCEADDIIGVICEKQITPGPILIISPDKDFVQLQKYPNVKQFSNIQKKWIEPEVSALYDLELKVLKGDTGDGVPNVLSDDDCLITEGVRQSKLTADKIEKLMKDPEALGTTTARRVIRNRMMIDLSRTPDPLKEEILTHFSAKAKGSINGLMTLFTKHKMKMMMESLQDFEVKRDESPLAGFLSK